MSIQYIDPLSRAFERMKTVLFRPFDLGKWFTLGFTAFLASLMNSSGGGGANYNVNNGDFEWDTFYNLPERIMGWISTHPFWMGVITVGIIVLIAIAVILTWLSSRGMFMFLDNVVHNRSLIERPWREFKTLGDSLFLWRILFMIISTAIFLVIIIAAFFTAYKIYLEGGSIFSHIMQIAGIALIGLLFFMVMFYIWIFLKDFITPIMYKTGLGVTEAWRRFFTLFGEHTGHFILYGLFTICLYILVAICVIVAGLVTCCCGFILLAIPYIGSVLMLPVSVTFRAFSLEYLAQFGDEYRTFPVVTEAAGAAPGGSVNPAA